MKTSTIRSRHVWWALFCVCLVAGRLSAGEPQADNAWQIGQPIVTYWAGPAMNDATAKQMADGGWNVVWCGEKELDVVQRHGLRGMLFAPDLLTPATLDDPARQKQLDELIQRVSRHPALVPLLHYR